MMSETTNSTAGRYRQLVIAFTLLTQWRSSGGTSAENFQEANGKNKAEK